MATGIRLAIRKVILDGVDISNKVSGVKTSWKPGELEVVTLDIFATKVELGENTITIETWEYNRKKPEPPPSARPMPTSF